ncbi:hypothetical protein LU290_04205 [Moraxella nasibovis]|uniref:AAA family ATPase n=1 Tax=Moraxella nasibovis TaxID=2904120 RepID=UPI00240EA1DA|nr:SbcC/MukB-like Walker B domain-containing protein [Moraxella nasibovis]WFF39426.1 hypothetical protein LU290_04205 [Moraxella nasibovis]
MKILSLTFTNLNSLKGSWHIDFTDDAYERDGIFTIIGQTGAGKTTILDAICLAIYGQTPRIKQISATHNELMSLGTSECMAQVELSMGGECYRFNWQQRRAGGKTDGKLQAIRREISLIKHPGDDDGKILETKPSLCDKKAVEIMRMNFEQFTRSVLLAQGNFAAFLKADAGEKGEILEQITGTEIYAQISAKAFETEKAKRLELTALQDKLTDHAVMSDEEFAALSAAIADDKAALDQQEDSIERLETALKQLEQKSHHEQKISNLSAQLLMHQAAFDDFRPSLTTLENANKAHELQSQYAHIQQLKNQQNQLYLTQNTLKSELERRQKDSDESLHQKNQARDALLLAQKDEADHAEIFRQVRRLDETLFALNGEHRQLKDMHDQQLAQMDALNHAIKQSLAKQCDTQNKLQELQSIRHTSDDLGQDLGFLNAHLSELARQISHAKRLDISMANTKRHLDDLQTKLTQKRDEYKQLNNALTKHQNTHQTLKNNYCLALSISQLDEHHLSEQGMRTSQELHTQNQLKNTLQELHTVHQAVQTTSADIHHETKQLGKYRTHIDTLNQTLSHEHTTLSSLEENKTLQLEIKALQKQLSHLQDGKPCPLCGSLEHPNKLMPQQKSEDSTDDAILHTKAKITQLTDELSDANAKQIISKNNLENLNEKLQQLRTQQSTLNQKIHEIKNHAQAHGITSLDDISLDEKDDSHLIEMLTACKDKIDALNQALSHHQALAPKLQRSLQDIKQYEDQLLNIQHEGSSIRDQLGFVEQDFSKICTESAELSDAIKDSIARLTTTLHKHGITLPVQSENASIPYDDFYKDILDNINKLSVIHQASQQAHHTRQALERTLDNIAIHLSNHQKDQERLSQLQDSTAQKLDDILQKTHKLQSQRQDLFGQKIVDDEESALKQRIKLATNLLTQSTEAHTLHQSALTSLGDRLSETSRQLDKLRTSFDESWQDFGGALLAKGFLDEAQFLAARLSDEDRQRLQEQSQTLQYAISKTKENLEQEQELLAALMPSTAKLNADDLTAQRNALQHSQRNLLQNLGKNQQILDHAAQERSKQAALRAQIQQKTKDIEVWAKLNELIGSKEGKKYRNFVQGLTLEAMLFYANQVLARMSERYILCHASDDNKLLEINIIDTQQGSEERSTKNLSGGESFIISLSLALGLSMMSSENIRIDSLFLDEGFGTLDEEILDIALATLDALQEEGRMIGIISHVASLKERIGTQIIVHKGANGASKLSGAGVSLVG